MLVNYLKQRFWSVFWWAKVQIYGGLQPDKYARFLGYPLLQPIATAVATLRSTEVLVASIKKRLF
jgi:hypothetical protein